MTPQEQKIINNIGNNPNPALAAHVKDLTGEMLNAAITAGDMKGIPLALALAFSSVGCAILGDDNNRLAKLLDAKTLNFIATDNWLAGTSILWWAVYNKQWDLCWNLIENGTDIHATATADHFAGLSVLLSAALMHQWDLVNFLIAKGANINATITTGYLAGKSVLWLAILDKEASVAKNLIARGANVNTAPICDTDKGKSPLWLAGYTNQWDIAKILIDNNANINAIATNCDEHAGVSFLWLVANNNLWDIFVDSIKKGADIGAIATNGNIAGISILSILAFYNKIDDLEVLIKEFNLDIQLDSLIKYKEKSKKIAKYKACAPIISSIYTDPSANCLYSGLTQTERGLLTTATKILGHVCDDDNARQYDADGFAKAPMCEYLIKMGNACKQQFESMWVKEIFNKAEGYLLAINDSFKYSISDKASKIKYFFEDEASQELVLSCPNNDHGMIAKLSRKDQRIFLHIYNDGLGLEHHPFIVMGSGHKKYSNSIVFELSKNIDKNSYTKVINLLSSFTVDTNNFYENLRKMVLDINAKEVHRGLNFSTTQRSNTCTLKSLRSFLQGYMSREEYLLHKFIINVATFKEYYNLVKYRRSLLPVAKRIISICENNERLAVKFLEVEKSLPNAEIKQWVDKAIQEIQNIKHEAQQELRINSITHDASKGTSFLPYLATTRIQETAGLFGIFVLHDGSPFVQKPDFKLY